MGAFCTWMRECDDERVRRAYWDSPLSLMADGDFVLLTESGFNYTGSTSGEPWTTPSGHLFSELDLVDGRPPDLKIFRVRLLRGLPGVAAS